MLTTLPNFIAYPFFHFHHYCPDTTTHRLYLYDCEKAHDSMKISCSTDIFSEIFSNFALRKINF